MQLAVKVCTRSVNTEMIFIFLVITAFSLLYVYLKWAFSYWEREGFPSTGTSIPFGALDAVCRGKRSFGMAIYDMYLSNKNPLVGIYLSLRPALLVRDAQLAHDMLVKDFASFHNRGVYVDEKKDPMSAGLFALKGIDWKTMRQKLSPSFTSGKLKAMFSTSEAVGDKLVAHLNAKLHGEGTKEIDIKKLMSTYAIDIIGSTIFGLDVDSFAEPKNEFYSISKTVNRPIFKDIIRGTSSFLYPKLEEFFVAIGWKQESLEDMRELVNRTIAFREQNNVTRRDMLQLLLQLRNSGSISSDDNMWTAEKNQSNYLKTLTNDLIAGQLFLFFVAGYETTASTAAFTLYEMAQNPDVLAKAQENIQSTLEKHDGKLSYDAIQDMQYLELCLKETARKYPALPLLNRECTKDYVVPGSQLIIKQGTPIIISLIGLHRDEEYFPDPLRYFPERFTEEHMNHNPAAYMPFGEGPRQCIAARMGKVNAKIALVKILMNYNVETLPEKREIEFANHGVPLMAKGGVPVKLSQKASYA
ncbi:probable cytochrome P450 6d5 [Drosophila tropicalis]|uniref:probable cytochrome P450 6d5 n=1 Tax=Drosophila tropicalis TaxID=46794 RepID=UPI0035AB999E